MQLWQLGLLVITGVTLIVVLVHLSGGSRDAALDGEQQAMQRFAEDFPAIAVNHAVLTQSGNAAFLFLRGGNVGLVHAIGDKFLTRIVEQSSLVDAKADGQKLSIQLGDIMFPGAQYEFAKADTAALLARHINLIKGASNA